MSATPWLSPTLSLTELPAFTAMPNLLSPVHDPVFYSNPDLDSDLALACPSSDFLSTIAQAAASFPPSLFERNLCHKQYDMVPPRPQKRSRSSTLSTTVTAVSPDREFNHRDVSQYHAEPQDPNDSEYEDPNLSSSEAPSFKITETFRKQPRRSTTVKSYGEPSSPWKAADNNAQTDEEDEEEVIVSPSTARGKQHDQLPASLSSERNRAGLPKQARGRRAALVKTPTKAESAFKQRDESEGNQVHRTSSSRKLRDRTLQQLNPFQFDKIQHNLNTKGHVVNNQEMEEIVQQTLEGKHRQTRSTEKRTRQLSPEEGEKPKEAEETKVQGFFKADASSAPTKRRKMANQQRSGSVLSSVLSFSEFLGEASRRERTTLKIWLEGFKGGSVPIPLKDCQDVGGFVDRIIKAWDWQFDGARFSYAIATFPWLTEDANIVIRSGMEDSFQSLMDEVERAPMWAEENKARCEVKVTVYVE